MKFGNTVLALTSSIGPGGRGPRCVAQAATDSALTPAAETPNGTPGDHRGTTGPRLGLGRNHVSVAGSQPEPALHCLPSPSCGPAPASSTRESPHWRRAGLRGAPISRRDSTSHDHSARQPGSRDSLPTFVGAFAAVGPGPWPMQPVAPRRRRLLIEAVAGAPRPAMGDDLHAQILGCFTIGL